MIFTASRTSFLIVVPIGFICYLYCSFCIYVHQIYTCFELLEFQNKERRNENSTDMSTSLSTIFNNYNSSIQFNGLYSECGTSLPSKGGSYHKKIGQKASPTFSVHIIIFTNYFFFFFFPP